MSKYFNTGNDGFKKARNDEYIDKSELIGFVNRALNTEHNMICVTRARRFGKSMAAKMLCAYYDQTCDSRNLFSDLKIAQDGTFEQHLNRYPVINLDVSYFTTTCNTEDIVRVMEQSLIEDLHEMYPYLPIPKNKPLIECLLCAAESNKQKFIMVVDEWDAICRESDSHPESMRKYVDWLRSLYKTPFTDRVFAGVYMTGILPIIQYDTQSALNNFDELTLISPGSLADCFGFVNSEVQVLCDKYKVNFEDIKFWYDGYNIGETKEVFNPYSVMSAFRKHSIESYWATTGAYEGLKKYIQLNYDGLKDSILTMMAGESVDVNVLRFSNDLHKIQSRDDALTTLIHLGYLTYDDNTKKCRIPNYEVKLEFDKSVRDSDWTDVINALTQSEMLLQHTLECDENQVAQSIENIHEQFTSVLKYNDENALSMVLTLAYYMAQNKYSFIREFPAGKGFADIVLMPKHEVNIPAILLELKWNQKVETAINQIKNKNYAGALSQYVGDVILVGVTYDKKSKKHRCRIEKYNVNEPHCEPHCEPHYEPHYEPQFSQRQQQILDLIRANPSISKKQMAEILQLSQSTIKRELKFIPVRYEGNSMNGAWKEISL